MNMPWKIALGFALLFGVPCCDVLASERPNVLFIAVDDLNDWVGFLEGHSQVKTPHMDRLAKRGIVFANAHCAAPICCPSRAAVLSGLQPFRTGIYHNGPNIVKLRPDLVLFPQYFSQHGYRTLGTGKILHHGASEIFDEYFATHQRWSPLKNTSEASYTPEELLDKSTNPRHVVHYGLKNRHTTIPLNHMPSDRNPEGPQGESFDWGPFDVSDDEMGDGKITAWAIDQLQQASTEKPWLLCVGYYRPHIPLWAPRKYFDLYPASSIKLPDVLDSDLGDLSEAARRWAIEPVTAGSHATVVQQEQWKAAVTAYLACVSFVDAQVGRLLETLDSSPHQRNTVVVLWSDHGWHLGEKQHWGKWTGWERSTRVPLVIIPPQAATATFATGDVCDQPVSLIDLYPTMLELCRLPEKSDLDGNSLVPVMKVPTTKMPPVVTTFDRGNYSIRTSRWRLIHYEEGYEELYDHQNDPNEWHNLSEDPAHQQIRRQLQNALPKNAVKRLGYAGAQRAR